MILYQRLLDIFEEKAKALKVSNLTFGIGYTFVETSDNGIGIAYTYKGLENKCWVIDNYEDFEDKSAIELLKQIKSSDPLKKSAALALINALNYHNIISLPVDDSNRELLDRLSIDSDTYISMVGDFKPVIKRLKQKGATVEVIDDGKGVGDKALFLKNLENKADILIISSTSILNGTTEKIIKRTGREQKAIMLGPSTPLVREAFVHLPVDILAGTVLLDKKNVLKAVRHGTGTKIISRFGRKVIMNI